MITSTGNARIRSLVHLKKSRKERREADCFLVEGPKMFRELPPELLREAYASASFLRSAEGREIAAQCGKEITEVSDEVFQYLSDTKSPQGILALVSQLHYAREDLTGEKSGKKALLMILEDVQDPGNVGTILRTAEAAGATGVLLTDGCADLTAPKTVRSTMGSIYRVPFLYTRSLAGELDALKKEGVRTFAAHLKGAVSLWEADMSGPAAFLIGNESRGLREETAALADASVKIPMSGRVESLNAAMAGSLLLYEAKRQRS